MTSNTKILSPDDQGYKQAADLLRRGEVVSFPTETVYGLGADARDDRAVAKIFEAKSRPAFNPLIVHVPDIKSAQTWVAWTDDADRLARAFWPGPLTLVLPLLPQSTISPLVTAGHQTLAIRVPAHSVAQELLKTFEGPIAAPSANPSGRISPTTADHVIAGLDGKIAAVLDGGRCEVGLESTIVGLAAEPVLLRPGGVPKRVLEAALGRELSEAADNATITAPGQLKSHYAPGASVRLNADTKQDGEVMLGFGAVECDLNLSLSGDLIEAAANLFSYLHKLDAMRAPIAVSPIPGHGLGRAINDRLRRAAAPRT